MKRTEVLVYRDEGRVTTAVLTIAENLPQLLVVQEQADEAKAARDVALAAQGGAVSAQAGSEVARDAAQDAQGSAVVARSGAESARVGAEAAAAISTAAANTATGARDTVVAAVAGAEDARDSALFASASALSSAGDASNSAADAAAAALAADVAQAEVEASIFQAQGYAADAAGSAAGAAATMAGSVRFDATQSLTAPQKTQALSNIGAQPVGGYVRYDSAQSLTQADQDLARGNISAMGRLSGGRVTSGSSLTIDLSAYLAANVRRFRLEINRFQPTGSALKALSMTVRNTSNAWISAGYVHAGVALNATEYAGWGGYSGGIYLLESHPTGLVSHGSYEFDVNNADDIFTLRSNVTLGWYSATDPAAMMFAAYTPVSVNAIRLDTDGTYSVLDWTLYGVQR